jgi:hypothetical protein
VELKEADKAFESGQSYCRSGQPQHRRQQDRLIGDMDGGSAVAGADAAGHQSGAADADQDRVAGDQER